jgi:hypothetical protein
MFLEELRIQKSKDSFTPSFTKPKASQLLE